MTEIVTKTSLEELMTRADEEATELARTLIWIYQFMFGVGSTQPPLAEARKMMIDAIAGANVAIEALRLKLGITCDEIAEAEDAEIERWKERVKNGI